MKCRICGTKSKQLFETKILNKYLIKYFKCDKCGLIQTEKPYWLIEAYKNPINDVDTGLLSRNYSLLSYSSILIYYFFSNKGKFLDYAGGYGVFTRLMRDVGFDFYWYDPMSTNLFAKGFEYRDDMKIELLTAFECFEHFVDPVDDFEKMLKLSKNILFSTSLLPNPLPKPDEWWYYGFDHGQHIAFYTEKTFEYLASKNKLNYINLGNGLGLMCERKINRRLITISFLFRQALMGIVKKKMRSFTFLDMENLKK